MKFLFLVLSLLITSSVFADAPECFRYPVIEGVKIPYTNVVEMSVATSFDNCPMQILINQGMIATLFRIDIIDNQNACVYRTNSIAFYCKN